MKNTHAEGFCSVLRSRFARGVVPLVAALFACALAAPEARAAVRNIDFAKKMTLMPSATALAKIGESAFENFPVLVRLPAEVSEQLQSANGTDLFFTDENDASLPFEVEAFDPAGTTFVWVKVPSLSASTELMVWFGGASNQDNDPTAVWSRYVGVWHYAPSDAGGSTVADATGHGLTGSTTGALSTYAGPFGGDAIHGTATVTAPNYDALVPNAGQFTASGWFKAPSQVGDYLTFVSKKTGLNWDDAKGWYLEMAQSKTKMNLVLGNSTTSATIPDVSANWNYFSIVSDGTNVKVYMNGSTSASITKAYAVTASGRDFVISPNKADNCTDEYRIRKGAAGAAETALEYATMADAAFFDLGAIESVDDTAQVFETPTIVRNANGTYTVTVVLSENSGDVGVIYDAGETAITNVIQAAVSPGTYTDTPVNLTANTTYKFAAYGKNAKGTESVKKGGIFYNGDISIAKISDANENGLVTGVFRISRADTANDLAVTYMVSGTAAAGQTYGTLSGAATIPAGSSSVDVEVVPLIDAQTTEDKTVVLTLNAGLYGIDAQAGSAELTVVNLATPAGYNTWISSSNSLASIDCNWSAGHRPTSSEKVLFDGRFSTKNCEWDAAATPTVASWTQTADYNGTVQIDTTYDATFPALNVTGDVEILGGNWTHKINGANDGQKYHLKAIVGGDFTLASGCKLDAEKKGYWAQKFPAGSAVSAHAASGDGYANVYGNVYRPADLGAGSYSSGSDSDNKSGGGAVWLEIGGAATLNGTVNVRGRQFDGSNTACGSVYVKAKSCTGSGSILANYATSGYYNGNRGAGGRVAIELTEATALGLPVANVKINGVCSGGSGGGGGTFYLKTADPAKPNGTLYLDDVRTKSYGARWHTPQSITAIPAGETWTFDAIVISGYGMLAVPAGTTLNLPNGPQSVSATSTIPVPTCRKT